MRPKSILSFVVLALAGTLACAVAEEGSAKLPTVSVRKLADSLHAVIVADQAAYVDMVPGRASTLPRQARDLEPVETALGASVESGNKAANAVAALPPNHAVLLRLAARKIQTSGAEFSYTLRSLAPIDPNNGPQTQVEQDGLEHVGKTPNEPYYANEQLGGRSYFTAVYAERATSGSCIECHNQNPKSPRHDLKQGDVLGAIVVRVPLEF
jgi:hypothetical protein